MLLVWYAPLFPHSQLENYSNYYVEKLYKFILCIIWQNISSIISCRFQLKEVRTWQPYFMVELGDILKAITQDKSGHNCRNCFIQVLHLLPCSWPGQTVIAFPLMKRVLLKKSWTDPPCKIQTDQMENVHLEHLNFNFHIFQCFAYQLCFP